MDAKTPFVLSTIAALGTAIAGVDSAVAELHRVAQRGALEPLPHLLMAQPAPEPRSASRSVLGAQPGSLLESATAVLANLQRAPGTAPATGAGSASAPSPEGLRTGSEISVRPWFPGRQSVGVTVELSW